MPWDLAVLCAYAGFVGTAVLGWALVEWLPARRKRR